MRIVTYNTRGSLGMDDRRDTRRIADVVRSLSPDVVCFQEIHQKLAWSGREDQPAALSELLGRPFAFQRCLTFGFGGYGIGIAARGTVAERREHLLPSRKEQRGALELRLRQVGGLRALTVICTHWGLQEEERQEQAEALAGLVAGAAKPLVLCGDLNEGPEAEGVRALLAATGLIDADAIRNRPTFTSSDPTVRIDYCLHSPDLSARHIEVVSSLASDHLPLLADLEKQPSNR
jgi:endonuclease/exonuclease/phosphatase family metal-dependent hydrolase